MSNWINTANGREGTAYEQGLKEGRREARAELEPVLMDTMKVIKKHKTMSLSHYVDCKYYDDDNEDECDSVCDCGVWQLYCENKQALAKLRSVLAESQEPKATGRRCMSKFKRGDREMMEDGL